MLSFVRGLFDRILLIGAVVAGGLVPGFISQYRQRLGGRLDQAQLDLQPWQKIADQFYHGDIQRLIQYHLNSTDTTFHAEGAVIRSLVLTVQHLQSAVDALQGNLFAQVQYIALHGDRALAQATFGDWVPTVAFSLDGVLFALLFGLAIWLLFHSVWVLFAFGGRRLRARRRRVPLGHAPTSPRAS